MADALYCVRARLMGDCRHPALNLRSYEVLLAAGVCGGIDEDFPCITSLAVACPCGSPAALPEPVCGRASTEACSGSFRVAGKAEEARSNSRSAAGGAAPHSSAKGSAVTVCTPRSRILTELAV